MFVIHVSKHLWTVFEWSKAHGCSCPTLAHKGAMHIGPRNAGRIPCKTASNALLGLKANQKAQKVTQETGR